MQSVVGPSLLSTLQMQLVLQRSSTTAPAASQQTQAFLRCSPCTTSYAAGHLHRAPVWQHRQGRQGHRLRACQQTTGCAAVPAQTSAADTSGRQPDISVERDGRQLHVFGTAHLEHQVLLLRSLHPASALLVPNAFACILWYACAYHQQAIEVRCNIIALCAPMHC